MRRGAWHQFGDRSQKMVLEQLQHGVGVGAIISPRDLARHKAIDYAKQYHHEGAHVLIDQQFHFPDFSNRNLGSYPISEFRQAVSQLRQITDPELSRFSADLHADNRELAADGLIAPAIVYEAGRPDIVTINSRLFSASKRVGDNLGIPTYATVVVGQSAAKSDQTIDAILSHATSMESDGWYFGFEFEPERIPSSQDNVLRCCRAGLTLACTGKPVLHSYAGPMALLSLGFGATGAAVGHSQNLWRFGPDRWKKSDGQGGGGDAPPRFFSASLWGTIVYPDETARLANPTLKNAVMTLSPFSDPVSRNLAWSRWDANKHLIFTICSTIGNMSSNMDPRANAGMAINLLRRSLSLHQQIENVGVQLSDNTNVYQNNWMDAMSTLLSQNSGDFDYMSLII